MNRQFANLSLLIIISLLLVLPVFGQASNTCNAYTSIGNPYPCCDNDGDKNQNGPKDGNCTWWAWKRAKETWGNMPSVSWGGAGYSWVTYARNAGYQVLTSPAPESIGITSGHVAWVETVNTNQNIGTTEMNCGYPTLPQGGWKDRSFTYFTAGYVYPAARISAIQLIDPYRSSFDRDVTVLGDGFAPNLTVQVTFPNGGQATLSGTQIKYVTRKRFVMRVKLNAAGAWRFRVLNPQGGTGSQSNLFSIYVW